MYIEVCAHKNLSTHMWCYPKVRNIRAPRKNRVEHGMLLLSCTGDILQIHLAKETLWGRPREIGVRLNHCFHNRFPQIDDMRTSLYMLIRSFKWLDFSFFIPEAFLANTFVTKLLSWRSAILLSDCNDIFDLLHFNENLS